MNNVISRRVAKAVMALGIGASVLGIGATGAFATAKATAASGSITSVSAKTDKLVVKVGTKADTFKTTAMTVIDLGGKKSSLAKLKAGDKVTVDYTTSGKTMTASKIVATA